MLVLHSAVCNLFIFSDKVGVKLSNTFYESQINPLVPDNNANGYIDTIISDTTNWLPFQFSFIADSTYQYLYLGNFFDGANTDSIQAFNTVNGQGAYYFIDALCLSTDSNYCETILSSIESKSEPFIIYPNPTSQFLFIKNLKYSMLIHIYDLIGREVFSIQLNKEDSSLDISSLPAGNYFIVADNPKFKSIIFQKI
ncbi:MAG: T9SS type A sorting domain-containing protein [Bacteroidetes bacterium]|nr:T9SS type A sorting domain-containing protein [Bacteroidota bacterium]